MKKWKKAIPVLSAVVAAAVCFGVTGAQAGSTENETILDGIYIGSVSVGGMTYDEAQAAISDYVDEISGETVTLAAEGNSLETTLEEMGFSEDVEATLHEALEYGRTGNLVMQYKERKDLEHEDKVLPLTLTVDEDQLTAYLEENADAVNQDAVDYGLTRENGEFVIIEGQNGLEVNVAESVQVIADYFAEGWQESPSIELAVTVTEPQGTEEELSKVQDVLGTYSTDYSSSASGRKQNVANGASLINGSVVYPGETFSVYETVSPFEAENGYTLAGSYENGTTVETYGGGICQVSTTFYNAVIRAELEIVERYGHSMIVTYVEPSADAAIAGTYKDLKFTNNTDAPIYIEGAADGATIRFTVYGEETRASNREVSFVSETTSTTEATVEFKATSASIGTITKVQSSHTGKTARLWKIVTVDGVEESREVFNNTTYKMSPTIYEVGTSSSSEEAVAAMKAAIATNDLSTIQAAAAQWNDEALEKAAEEEAAAEEAAAEEAAAEEAAAAEKAAAEEAAESSTEESTETSADSGSSEEAADTSEESAD
ncbi:MAG: VanW family protein [Clostridiales bacterium]|nr:VanW family protein [Clostridiales bacterium]